MTHPFKASSPRRFDLSATGWTRVVLATAGGTAFCIAAALFVDSFNFATMNEPEIRRAVATDILLPTGLAAPLLFLLTYKMRQLAIAYAKLMVVATTDSLTNLLNRRAFTVLVEAFLERVDVAPSVGALLIVDADNCKRINDEFGHECGDVALRIIAQAISKTLRDADIVGRIGGEEFAVLLPGATARQAAAAAERIRRAVSDAVFTTNEKARPLTASVGGVAFDRTATYDQLFVAADRRLYEAKAGVRDGVSMEFLAQPVVA